VTESESRTAEQILAETKRLISEGMKALSTAPDHDEVEGFLRRHLCERAGERGDAVDVGFSWTPDKKVTIQPRNLFTTLLCWHVPTHRAAPFADQVEGEAKLEIGTFVFRDGQGHFTPREAVEFITFELNLPGDGVDV